MQRFYFDYNATTPVAPEVLEVHAQVLREVYGNASSIHQDGQLAKQTMETARRQVAGLLGCDPREIVFTSGGTEADNLAILGTVRDSMREHRHVVTTAIEHPAVRNTCEQLRHERTEVTVVPVDSTGVVDPDDVRRALRPETVLVSVMHANNEIGTIQPVSEIAEIAREAGVAFHSDGVQAAGRVSRIELDLYSVSAHKMYAPKGIGALVIRKGTELMPLLYGGKHEAQRRAGTENVPGIAAFGRAAAWLRENGAAQAQELAILRDRLEAGILDRVPDAHVNGSRVTRLHNTTNIRFDGISGESMVIALDLRGFACSSGSACSSGAVEPSPVLLAIGLTREEARSSLRFSLGRFNTAEQVDALIEAVAESASQLRRISPHYAYA